MNHRPPGADQDRRQDRLRDTLQDPLHDRDPGGGHDGPRALLTRARLYLLTAPVDDAVLDAAIRGGVDLVQLSHTGDADDGEIVATARRLGSVCRPRQVPLLLNGRPDLVEASGADGVHLNADDGAVARAREIVGAGRIVGLWARSEAHVDAAMAAGVDYLSVGPINPTPTLRHHPATGIALAAYAIRQASVPVFAIGGLDSTNLHPLGPAGISRIAVHAALVASLDPEHAAAELRAALDRYSSELNVALADSERDARGY
jgi:thiamine-phosphate pyrophosphorylase